MTDNAPQRVAIVTGVLGGIGMACVEAFLDRDVAVVGVDLAGVDDTGLRALGRDDRLRLVTGDVAEEETWHLATKTAVEEFGGLDVVVNNAGTSGPLASVRDYPMEDFDEVMRVNVRSVMLGTKIGARALRDGRGAIVNIASIAGIRGSHNLAAYVASKHAVVGLTRLSAMELAPDIRVNAVCPSPTDTEMMRIAEAATDLDPVRARRALSSMIPMRRYGEPSEIAAMIAFLASDESSFTTGGVFSVDGGMSAT